MMRYYNQPDGPGVVTRVQGAAGAVKAGVGEGVDQIKNILYGTAGFYANGIIREVIASTPLINFGPIISLGISTLSVFMISKVIISGQRPQDVSLRKYVVLGAAINSLIAFLKQYGANTAAMAGYERRISMMNANMRKEDRGINYGSEYEPANYEY